MVRSIPKTIHYCWFGKKPLPPLAQKCIASWRVFLPDYEIIEWNEDNYDVNKIPYTREAYSASKYAFVSDFVRFDVLYQYGGVYFDTDVEVIRSLDPILVNGAFMGCEKDGLDNTLSQESIVAESGIAVAPGLGIAVPPGNDLIGDIIDYYSTLSFKKEDGSNDTTTIVYYTTQIMKKYGLKNVKGIQHIAGITIYPKEYFSPKDVDTKELVITDNTYTIHHYDSSWAEWYDRAAGERGPKLKRLLGNTIGGYLNIMIYLFQRYGIKGVIRKLIPSKEDD